MLNIIKEELPMEEGLRKKINLICEFAKVKPTIINGSIRKIEKNYLSYIVMKNYSLVTLYVNVI